MSNPFKKSNYHFKFFSCNSEEELYSNTADCIAELLKSSKYTNRKGLVITKSDKNTELLHSNINEDYRDYADKYQSNNILSYSDFAEGKYDVLIANSELGIGVNLPDVTDTIHLGLPISKSQYVQEFGRAGRLNNDAYSSVYFISKDYYDKEKRIFLHRSTPIEDLINMLKNIDDDNDDLVSTFEKILGNIEDQKSYYNGVVKLYNKIKSISEGTEITIITNQNEEYYKEVSKYMRYLYVLYRVGILYGWYIVKLDEQKNSFSIFIDPYGTRKTKCDITEINDNTVRYLHKMGDYKKDINLIKKSVTEEETIYLFIDWYYHQFLYHHREQLLEMINFLESYKNKGDDTIVDSLSNYFSLSLIEIQNDTSKANELTIKDISIMIKNGVDTMMADNIRKSNENEYSTKLDYFLFIYDLYVLNNIDISRLDRILSKAKDIEFSEILEEIWFFYQSANDRTKISMLNSFCKYKPLEQVIDSIYSKTHKDLVYCGIISLCANNRFGGSYV